MQVARFGCGLARHMAPLEMGGGALFGLIYGPLSILLITPLDMAWRAAHGYDTSYILDNTLIALFMAALVGMVVGLVVGFLITLVSAGMLLFSVRCWLRRIADTPRYRQIIALFCALAGAAITWLCLLRVQNLGYPSINIVGETLFLILYQVVPTLAAGAVAWRAGQRVVDWVRAQSGIGVNA